MSFQRPDSGITMDFSEDSHGTVEQGADSPDTGLGTEITRLGAPKSQFSHLYGDNKNSSANYPDYWQYMKDIGKPLIANDSVELEEGGAQRTNDEENNEKNAEENQKEALDVVVDLTPGTSSEKALPAVRKERRSQSVQLESSSTTTRGAVSNWQRASSFVLGRSISAGAEDKESRPTSAMTDKLRYRKQSYGNAEGVQLRGDKGKARRKSAISTTSSQSTNLPISNEWKKFFDVPYSPRPKATKIIRATIAPPRIGKLNCHNDLKMAEPSANQRPWRQLPGQTKKHDFYQSSNTQHVEIHYEKCLPKENWLEMKPKRFAHNHRHGNHFELRKLVSKDEVSAHKSNVRKEAFVWENPHQIWLMEKTHVD